jgi:hypothetical protein
VTILRDAIERNFQAPLAAMLPGGNARERAALLLSIIAGIQLMRQVVGLDALVAESPEAQSVLERELEALFDLLIRLVTEQPKTRRTSELGAFGKPSRKKALHRLSAHDRPRRRAGSTQA